MEIDLRGWLLMGSNALLYWLLQMLNDVSGASGITLSLNALYLVIPAACMRQRWALLLVFATGWLIDAPLPVAFGFHSIIFAIVVTLLHAFQRGLSRAGLGQLVLVALGVNTVLILVQSLLLAGPLLGNGAYWVRIASDLAFSSLALPLIGWWFFSWERWLLMICGSGSEAPETT
ncbi:hypothetical protein H5P28_07375 [Ruficoccus amylovorans]|uniref:Rod shape-determining protein MreD n=1 Tax=Ruficoccus amylovorans TaxID=1804625 RepID=A0A842HFL4_9BACT|nr:hypothetical protein [Ruficoccus amylovorans]MBC2594081.1 hypothetical protein [Ruficoccus amylovorans]